MVAVVVAIAVWRANVRSALATEAAARATEADAEASRQAVSLTRLQMRQAQMPVVMPVAYVENGRAVIPRAGSSSEAGFVPVSLPVRNIGAGAAFDIRANLQFGDVAGNPSPAGSPREISPPTYGALGAGQAARLEGRYARNLASPLLSLRFTLTYQDVFGDTYTSSGIYVEADLSLRDIVYNPPAELNPNQTSGALDQPQRRQARETDSHAQ
jgi:hypothetical protein